MKTLAQSFNLEEIVRVLEALAPHDVGILIVIGVVPCTFALNGESVFAIKLLGTVIADPHFQCQPGGLTLNRFINDTIPLRTDCGIYYFATGSGNDFLADIGGYYR